jgi:hypothetical protein
MEASKKKPLVRKSPSLSHRKFDLHAIYGLDNFLLHCILQRSVALNACRQPVYLADHETLNILLASLYFQL